jgi:hypothetical protein
VIPPAYILTTLLFGDMKSWTRAFGVVSGMGGIGAAMAPNWRPDHHRDQLAGRIRWASAVAGMDWNGVRLLTVRVVRVAPGSQLCKRRGPGRSGRFVTPAGHPDQFWPAG